MTARTVTWRCPPKTVLVGVDFGDAAARALAIASVVAAAVDARVRVMHAAPAAAVAHLTTFANDVEGENIMTIERSLRMIAGAFVAASVLLGIYVNPLFLWFTLFVGLNLFQSAFTQWCPMMTILRKAGVRG